MDCCVGLVNGSETVAKLFCDFGIALILFKEIALILLVCRAEQRTFDH